MTKLSATDLAKAIDRLADATGENPVAYDTGTGGAVDMSRTPDHKRLYPQQPVERGPITIVLPGERSISWNSWYSGKHWSQRNAEASRVHELVRRKLYACEMLRYPVDITVTVWFDRNPQDCSNIAAKFYEDGLIGILLVDDSTKHVRSMTTKSRIDKINPRVEIRIMEATE